MTTERLDDDLFTKATKLKEEGNGLWGKKNVKGAFQKWNEGRQELTSLM
jgi:hypothetical protein